MDPFVCLGENQRGLMNLQGMRYFLLFFQLSFLFLVIIGSNTSSEVNIQMTKIKIVRVLLKIFFFFFTFFVHLKRFK